MGFLKGKRTYLCGPISADKSDGQDWRDYLTPKLKKFGVIVDDPTKTTIREIGQEKQHFKDLAAKKKWKQLKEEFWKVCRKDLRSVDKSDFLIVFYHPEISTIGSTHEMVIAQLEKKPILLFCPPEKLNQFNPWISVLVKTQHIFTNWNDLLNYLKKINTGKLDTSLWE